MMTTKSVEQRNTPHSIEDERADAFNREARYDLTTCPPWRAHFPPSTEPEPGTLPLWSGAECGYKDVPNIDELVRVRAFGQGRVVSYFIESGFLGVEVRLSKPPKWLVKQNGDGKVMVFGAELEAW